MKTTKAMLKPGMTIKHVKDPCWIGKVLTVDKLGIRCRHTALDAQGIEHGSIECTFPPGELIIIEEKND